MEAQLIRMAIATLNSVEVKGKDNLSRMLGAMEALETIARALEQPREEAKEKPTVTGVNSGPSALENMEVTDG